MHVSILAVVVVVAAVFAMFWMKARGDGDPESSSSSSNDVMTRDDMLRKVSALYSAYLISWPIVFIYLCFQFDIRPNTVYAVPLLWPLVLFGYRLYNLKHNENRRQSASEAQFKESMLVQHSSLIISSIIAIALVLNVAGGGSDTSSRSSVSKKRGAQIVVGSIVLAMLSLSIESSHKPDSYPAALARAKQSMVTHTAAAIFLTGILLWYNGGGKEEELATNFPRSHR